LEDAQVVNLIVRRAAAGDSLAWEDLVHRFNRRIYNICYRFSGSGEHADDLTQEVFIKMYKTLSTYDVERGAFMTWVTTITRNLLVDHFRKSKQDRATDSIDAGTSPDEDSLTLADQLEDGGPRPDEVQKKRQVAELVHQGLQKLSPELREALILRDLQDMDYREIATALKVP
jgi:RNA polymerase sigma-70 factor (ECF subfamily)